MNTQARINAMIAYFFLGPIFLAVRSDTPIGDPYVRGHARRASMIMAIGIIVLIAYLFLLKPILNFQLPFGISLNSVILTAYMVILSGYLIHGAYRAYHGVDAREVRSLSVNTQTEQIAWTYSEEDKIRILASFIPFVGIFVARRYPIAPYTIGRRVGNLIALVLITLIVFYGGSVSTLVFAITILSIVLWIVTAVYLFMYDVFLSLSLYAYIPTYASIEAHIAASIISLYDFFRVAFGGEKRGNYGSVYSEKLELYETVIAPTAPYILPSWLIAIPGINLLTLPSIMSDGARPYHGLIAQGLIVTLATALVIWLYGTGSSLGLYLLFPLCTLLAYRDANLLTRAPFTSPIVSLMSLWSQWHAQVTEMGEKKEEVKYSYEVK
jgi:hypothetical protein